MYERCPSGLGSPVFDSKIGSVERIMPNPTMVRAHLPCRLIHLTIHLVCNLVIHAKFFGIPIVHLSAWQARSLPNMSMLTRLVLQARQTILDLSLELDKPVHV